jgi:ApaG protein
MNNIFDKTALFDKTTLKPYAKTSENIKITVWPEFIDSKTTPLCDLYIWAYHIRIENKGTNKVKLLSRYWKIIDQNGEIQEVSGDGVLGEQPIINPQESYNYSSGVHLKNPSGIMSGSYNFKNILADNLFDNGNLFNKFKAEIPTFSLDVPSIKNIVN